jgi:hypothetical protein
MTVKLVLLKSDEKLITDIKEGFYEEKLVCYLLENPCSVSINGSYKILDDENGGNRVSISLQTWPLLSKQTTIEIIPDWVVTMVEPNDELKEMYENHVVKDKRNESSQSIVVNEQPNFNQSN